MQRIADANHAQIELTHSASECSVRFSALDPLLDTALALRLAKALGKDLGNAPRTKGMTRDLTTRVLGPHDWRVASVSKRTGALVRRVLKGWRVSGSGADRARQVLGEWVELAGAPRTCAVVVDAAVQGLVAAFPEWAQEVERAEFGGFVAIETEGNHCVLAAYGAVADAEAQLEALARRVADASAVVVPALEIHPLWAPAMARVSEWLALLDVCVGLLADGTVVAHGSQLEDLAGLLRHSL